MIGGIIQLTVPVLVIIGFVTVIKMFAEKRNKHYENTLIAWMFVLAIEAEND